MVMIISNQVSDLNRICRFDDVAIKLFMKSYYSHKQTFNPLLRVQSSTHDPRRHPVGLFDNGLLENFLGVRGFDAFSAILNNHTAECCECLGLLNLKD